MTSTALTDRAEKASEASIRAQLARVLEEARAGLARMPLLHRRTPAAECDSVRTLMDAVNALLTEALQLTDALRGLRGLSVDGAMCCGAVAVAVNAATDALAAIQAQIDSVVA